MSLPKLAVERPITATMVLVSVLVIGGIALFRLSLAYLPTVDAPFIGVSVPYPNSNPQQIEREIVKPVEEILSTLEGIKKLRSEAGADGAEFWLEFDWGQELDIVRMQVSEKMDQIEASLPEAIGEVQIFSFNTNSMPVVQARISAQGVDLSANYELLEARVLNPLRRIDGVARVDLNGVAPRELFIDLILDEVKAHNVDIRALVQKLEGAGANTVLGPVDEEGKRYTARSLGSFDSIEAVGDLVIDETGLTLDEVAEISYEEPPIGFGRHLDGQHAIALEVFKESTANTVEVVDAVNRTLEEEINRDPLLAGINIFTWEDQGKEITSGIRGLRTAGLIGALLAIFSLYFFLRRLDSTLIVSLSIPFSIIAACGALYFMGKSLNILSMMGLMLAVGMLVDNGIVVLESIDRRLRDIPDRERAARIGTKEVSMAVIASTITTLIVFLPLVVGAKTGLTTWLREVGVTISVALVCSLFSSLTLIPLVAAHFLKNKEVKPSRFLVGLEERYAGVLGWTLDHRWKTAGLLVLFLGIGILPFPLGLVDWGMFTATITERLYLSYEFTDFAYKSEAERAVTRVERFLEKRREDFNIASIYSYFQENRAGTTMVMEDKSLDDDEMKELRSEIRESLPEIPGVKLRFENDSEQGGSSTFFAVKLYGQDTDELYGLADEAARRLDTLEGIEDIVTPRNQGQREVRVEVDREKIARMGMTAQDVSNLFGFTLGGMRLPRFKAGDREIETWLALRLEDRENLEDLKSIQFSDLEGRPIQLGDIARFEIVERPPRIRRENRKVQVAVDAVYEGDDWNDTKEEITGLMDALDLPAGYSWGWNDRIIENENQSAEMGVNFLLALLLVYLVMSSLFESLAQPFAILFSIVFALPGVFWTLAATGTPFNLMAQIGLLILMGIVVNNGIVLLDHMNQLRDRGLSEREAVLQAGRDRMRPILMTAATTVIGLLPLAAGGASVSGLMYFPMARTVMGGLITSAFVTLLVLPLAALMMEAVGRWLAGIWRASTPGLGRAPGTTGAAAGEPAAS
ncbi:MAG: efflux RND transporter permease subunit [Thermoanaerobaculia bacterium]|nr:efflux RND transporter permease subunit [Thermoanaerobaculia bacterium]